jgi:hypothetical protein
LALFLVAAQPIFKQLQKISVHNAINPGQPYPFSLGYWFGISLPGFIALHMAEQVLPYGSKVRDAAKLSKVAVGMPLICMVYLVDTVSSKTLRKLKLPDVPLDFVGTIGVKSDINNSQVLKDLVELAEKAIEATPEGKEVIRDIYKLQRERDL